MFYFLFIFLFIWSNSFPQGFEKEFDIYNNTLSVLSDSQKTAMGFKIQLNNFLWFDGTTLQTAVRYMLQNKLTEIGANINSYRNKPFYARYIYFIDDTTKDMAIDGYSIRISINHKITKNNSEIQFGISPLIYIHNQTPTTMRNKLYDYGGTALISYSYKRLHFWSSLSFRPETAYDVETCEGVYCNNTHSYLDSNNIFYFKTYNAVLYNFNFSRIFMFQKNLKLIPYFSYNKPIETIELPLHYSHITGGVNFSILAFSLIPEISLAPFIRPKFLPVYKLFRYGLLANGEIFPNTYLTMSYSKIGFLSWAKIYQQNQINIGLQYNF